MQIRVISVPRGEAPEDVRRAWVGLTLPLSPGETGSQRIRSHRLCTGLRSYLWYLWLVLTRRAPPDFDVYLVQIDIAFEQLSRASPHAVDWWRENRPDLYANAKQMAFYVEDCELIDDQAEPS